MITRTAFVQLNYSLLLLVATTVGMALTWLVPLAATLFGHGLAFWFGLTAWLMLQDHIFRPCAGLAVHRFGRRSLPLIAMFLHGRDDRIGGEPFSGSWCRLEGTRLPRDGRMTLPGNFTLPPICRTLRMSRHGRAKAGTTRIFPSDPG